MSLSSQARALDIAVRDLEYRRQLKLQPVGPATLGPVRAGLELAQPRTCTRSLPFPERPRKEGYSQSFTEILGRALEKTEPSG